MFNGNNNGYSLADLAAVTGNGNGWGNGFMGDGWWIILFFLFAFGGFGNGGWLGNGGFGANSAAYQGALTRGDLCQEFNFQNLEGSVSTIGRDVADLSAATQSSFNQVVDILHQGFDSNNISMLTATNAIQSDLNAMNLANVQSANAMNLANLQNTNAIQQDLNAMNIANMQNANAAQAQLTACCCDNQARLAQISYDMATNTCAINTNNANNTRDIIDSQNAGTRAILDAIQQNRVEALQEKIASLTSQNEGLRLAASQAAQNQYLISELRPSPVPAYQVANPYLGSYGYGCGGCGCNA